MKIQAEKWSKCECCGARNRLESDAIFGCDVCGINVGPEVAEGYLKVDIFSKADNKSEKMFCSWSCFFIGLKTIRTDYFISLPDLNFEKIKKGLRVEDFWQAIEDFK